MTKVSHLLVLIACAAMTLGLGKRKMDFIVSFHLETTEEESPKFAFKFPIPGTDLVRYFKVIPEFTHNDIAWFYPFPAKQNRGHGVVFKLKEESAVLLEGVSTQNQRRYLLVNVMGNTNNLIFIDRPVRDGMIVVWDSVTGPQLEVLNKELINYTEINPNAGAPPDQAPAGASAPQQPYPAPAALPTQAPAPATAPSLQPDGYDNLPQPPHFPSQAPAPRTTVPELPPNKAPWQYPKAVEPVAQP